MADSLRCTITHGQSGTDALLRRAAAQSRSQRQKEREREKEGGRTQCLEPVFPFKVASFCSLTGHEYQAEGAEREADTEPTRLLLLQSTENTTDFTPTESELRI